MKKNSPKVKRSIRHRRVRAKIFGSSECPRLSVYRSNKHLFLQLIDDEKGKTLLSISDVSVKSKKKMTKSELSFEAGKALAQKAVELEKTGILSLPILGEVYIKTGKRTEAIAVIKELEDKYAKKESQARSVARLYMVLGDNEKAIVWFEKAFTAKEFITPASLKEDKDAQALREDPRYKAMLKRLGLSE